MAGRPKKTATETKTTATESEQITNSGNTAAENTDTNDKLVKENEDLKTQLADLAKQFAELKASMETQTSAESAVGSEDTESDYVEISPQKPIRVMSLTPGGLSLRTNLNGSGKTFRFDKFGSSLSITYGDLQDIINTDRSFVEGGAIYICDPNVIKNHYYEDIYKKFLTVDTINNILTFDKDKIVDMVSNTTEPIQEAVIDVIVNKINRNEYVDMNKVEAIGKACKKPCDIHSLAVEKRSK